MSGKNVPYQYKTINEVGGCMKKMDAEKSWYKDCLERVKNTSSINFKHAYAKMMRTKGILQLSENIIDYCEKKKVD